MPHRLTVEELAKIDFAKTLPAAAAMWERVKLQAIRHTRGVKPMDLIGKQRPNESKFIMEYRLDNYRAITKEGVVKFNDKVSRIINSSGYTIGTQSDELRDWLENTTFPLGTGEKVTFDEYFSRLVMPCSFEDPNALLVAFPFNPDNPETPPANTLEDGGFPANQQISIKTIIVQSKMLRYVSSRFFVWEADNLWVFIHKGKPVEAPYFWIASNQNYFRLIPIGFVKDETGRKTSQIQYELQLWYNHDTGEGTENELPINVLGGTLTKDTANERVSYNNSFLQPYFEFGDECITTFSDWQAVRVKTAYPVKVMKKQPCSVCDGSRKIKVKTDTGEKLEDCFTCGGTGIGRDIGPFQTLFHEGGAGFNKEDGKIPVLEYIAPSTDNVKYLDDVWERLLEKAKKSINLDLLEDAVESGEAKKQRLQDLHDMLNKIAGNLFDVMESYLWFVECLLNQNRSQRIMPVIIRPISFDIKSEDMLMQEAKDALRSDKVTAEIVAFRRKYSGNSELIRIKELSILYAPFLTKTPEEIQIGLLGAYSNDDIIKADRVELILGEMVADGFDLDRPINQIFAEIDLRMVRFLPEAATPLVDGDGLDLGEGLTEQARLESEAKAKLRGTVGGVQGIIGITQAVASRTMTEAAAEVILQEIYGFGLDLAKKIIDIPALPNPQPPTE